MWCLNTQCTTLTWHMLCKLETHYTMMCVAPSLQAGGSVYARARTLIWNPTMIHTTHMPRWIHLLVKCLSLSVETENLCGLTNGHVADNRTRESVREDHQCMHVAQTLCMKGLCNALNNQFTTLMWHIWLTKWSIIPHHGGSRLVVYCRPPHTDTHIPHHHRHSEACQTFSAVNMWPKAECRVKIKKKQTSFDHFYTLIDFLGI